ncbi:hypothetical protein [Breoghania sp. L-A4]|uniref:hypothetical protein n=1 Tax=Breoghania sp. L-A4 TaxID=2304600 RepID=UPI0019677FC1|nr:hypothetical protein [Breoghania sp. L-A4]
MSDTTTVLIFALLPVLGNFAGSLLAECIHTPRWLLGAALHGAAGVAIALVSIDLMPRILQSAPMWLLVLAFLAGAFVSVMLYRGPVGRGGGRAREAAARGWSISP